MDFDVTSVRRHTITVTQNFRFRFRFRFRFAAFRLIVLLYFSPRMLALFDACITAVVKIELFGFSSQPCGAIPSEPISSRDAILRQIYSTQKRPSCGSIMPRAARELSRTRSGLCQTRVLRRLTKHYPAHPHLVLGSNPSTKVSGREQTTYRRVVAARFATHRSW